MDSCCAWLTIIISALRLLLKLLVAHGRFQAKLLSLFHRHHLFVVGPKVPPRIFDCSHHNNK